MLSFSSSSLTFFSARGLTHPTNHRVSSTPTAPSVDVAGVAFWGSSGLIIGLTLSVGLAVAGDCCRPVGKGDMAVLQDITIGCLAFDVFACQEDRVDDVLLPPWTYRVVASYDLCRVHRRRGAEPSPHVGVV